MKTTPDIKYLVAIDRIKFCGDQYKHTKFYFDHCERLFNEDTEQFTRDWNHWKGEFKAVFADTIEGAIPKLSAQLKRFCETVAWGPVNPKDLKFSIRYSDFNDGAGWLGLMGVTTEKYEI